MIIVLIALFGAVEFELKPAPVVRSVTISLMKGYGFLQFEVERQPQGGRCTSDFEEATSTISQEDFERLTKSLRKLRDFDDATPLHCSVARLNLLGESSGRVVVLDNAAHALVEEILGPTYTVTKALDDYELTKKVVEILEERKPDSKLIPIYREKLSEGPDFGSISPPGAFTNQ